MERVEEAELQRKVAVAAQNLAVSAEQLSIALKGKAYDKIVSDRRGKLSLDLEALKNALSAAGLVC
ncbi:MAG: hypothetical protein WCA49_08980 [Candidatus Sulfotelmatobacter sp.]